MPSLDLHVALALVLAIIGVTDFFGGKKEVEHVPSGNVQSISNGKIDFTFWMKEKVFLDSLPVQTYFLLVAKEKKAVELPLQPEITLDLKQLKGGNLDRMIVHTPTFAKISGMHFATVQDSFKSILDGLDDGEYDLSASVSLKGGTKLKTGSIRFEVVPFGYNKQNYHLKSSPQFIVECWTDGKTAKGTHGINMFVRVQHSKKDEVAQPKAKIVLTLSQIKGGNLRKIVTYHPAFVKKNDRWILRITDAFESAVTDETPNRVPLMHGSYHVDAEVWLNGKAEAFFLAIPFEITK